MSKQSDNIFISEQLSKYSELVYGFCNRTNDHDSDYFRDLIGISKLIKLKQIHSNIVHDIDFNTEQESVLEGDALVSSLRGICIGVYTADCIPILLYDTEHGVVAAVHAGWRGILNGIISETLTNMRLNHNCYPADIVSVIGPGIGKCCFEVDGDVAVKFIEKYQETDSFIYPCNSKYILDLQQINKNMLIKEGIENIEVIDICTKCDSNYYSYRREGNGVGSQLSFIGLRIRSGGI
jgi:YfiH family protein